MLSDSPAVAFIAASDLGLARAFYEGVLGLAILSHDDFAVVADAGGVRIRITQPPELVTAPYTVLGFAVADIAAEVASLTARGVVFERYAWFGEAQDETGVWATPDGGGQVAWLKDPDGDLLSLSAST